MALVESGAVSKKSVRGLRKELAKEAGRKDDDSSAMELAQAELTLARDEIEALAPEKDSFKAVRPGLEAIYGDGRAAYRTARKKPTTENLHEWRKRVKDLWYSASILRLGLAGDDEGAGRRGPCAVGRARRGPRSRDARRSARRARSTSSSGGRSQSAAPG